MHGSVDQGKLELQMKQACNSKSALLLTFPLSHVELLCARQADQAVAAVAAADPNASLPDHLPRDGGLATGAVPLQFLILLPEIAHQVESQVLVFSTQGDNQ